eukprot:scaffold14.g1124.t1
MQGGSSGNLEALLPKYARSNKEREMLESYADLYAIIKTIEKLERAFVRDAVADVDYTPACQKLLSQYRTLFDTIRGDVPDKDAFMQTYSMQCPMASRRIEVGMPATLEHGSAAAQGGAANSAYAVAETVQHFITTMDCLKINMTAVDQVYPLLSDLLQSLNRVVNLPPNLPGKEKVKGWVSKLHALPASHELGEGDVRQMLFDLESAYNELMNSINTQTTKAVRTASPLCPALCLSLVHVSIARAYLVGGGGPYQGRLEVVVGGQRGAVCDDGWGDEISSPPAEVLCRQLGLSGGMFRDTSFFGEAPGAVLVDDTTCSGQEGNLNECQSRRATDCHPDEAVGVICNAGPITGVHLADGDRPTRGRLEVQVAGGTWGAVCDDTSLDSISLAKVVCRQLGFPTAAARPATSSLFGAGDVPMQLTQMECRTGEEASLSDCFYSVTNAEWPGVDQPYLRCTPERSVGIICDAEGGSMSKLRLADGRDSSSGRVEVEISNRWGSVCQDVFSSSTAAAQVACRELGMQGGSLVPAPAYPMNREQLPILMDSMRCTGAEEHLSDCSYTLTNDCTSGEEVAVACTAPPTTATDQAIALEGTVSTPAIGAAVPGPNAAPSALPQASPNTATDTGIALQGTIPVTVPSPSIGVLSLSFVVSASSCDPALVGGLDQATAALLNVSVEQVDVACLLAGKAARRLQGSAQRVVVKATVRLPSSKALDAAKQVVLKQIEKGTFQQRLSKALPAWAHKLVGRIQISKAGVKVAAAPAPKAASAKQQLHPPGKPVLLSAPTIGKGRATIRVKAAPKTAAGAVTVTIKCPLGANAKATPRIARHASAGGTTFVISGLEPRSQLMCNIAAKNRAGISPGLPVRVVVP